MPYREPDYESLVKDNEMLRDEQFVLREEISNLKKKPKFSNSSVFMIKAICALIIWITILTFIGTALEGKWAAAMAIISCLSCLGSLFLISIVADELE